MEEPGCFHEVMLPAYNTEISDIKEEAHDYVDADPLAQDPLAPDDILTVKNEEKNDTTFVKTDQLMLLHNQPEPYQSNRTAVTVSGKEKCKQGRDLRFMKIISKDEENVSSSQKNKLLSELESSKKHSSCKTKNRSCTTSNKSMMSTNTRRTVKCKPAQPFHLKSRLQYKCFECGLYLATPSALVCHKKTHKRKYPFLCSICGRLFFTALGLRNHTLFHRPNVKLENSQMPQTLRGKRTSCFTCEKTFNDMETMEKHCDCLGTDVCCICVPEDSPLKSFTETTEKPAVTKGKLYEQGKYDGISYIICPQCGDIFRWMSTLTYHMKTQHASEEWKQSMQSKFSCVTCKKKFERKISLKMHYARTKCFLMKDLKNSKVYKCGLCKFTSDQKRNVVKHLLIHSSKHLFRCSYCTKTFTQRYSLTRHEIIHSGLRPYKCHICDATFADGSNCRSHELLHYGNSKSITV